jgi:hypothetical protein
MRWHRADTSSVLLQGEPMGEIRQNLGTRGKRFFACFIDQVGSDAAMQARDHVFEKRRRISAIISMFKTPDSPAKTPDGCTPQV